MDIVTNFLTAMQALMLVKVVLLLAVGLGLAIFGVVRRKHWLVAVGLVLAFGQFAWPWLSNRAQDSGVAARRNHVRHLPTTPLRADYPRRLIVEGDIVPNPPAWFIAAGYVDAVDIDGQRLVAVPGVDGCREAAMATFDPNAAASRKRREGNPRGKLRPRDKLRQCVSAGPAQEGGDAIILRVGNRTTLFDRENARRHGAPVAIQLSVRSGGRELLVHYDEMPILARPSSATRLLPEGDGYPCPGFATIQIVANFLDAAREPARAALFHQRGAARRSQYDPCIASAAPVPRQD